LEGSKRRRIRSERLANLREGGEGGGREDLIGGACGSKRAGREKGREGGREKGRKGGREGGIEEEGRKGWREGGREGGREGKTCLPLGDSPKVIFPRQLLLPTQHSRRINQSETFQNWRRATACLKFTA